MSYTFDIHEVEDELGYISGSVYTGQEQLPFVYNFTDSILEITSEDGSLFTDNDIEQALVDFIDTEYDITSKTYKRSI